jgi:hypothetical protein
MTKDKVFDDQILNKLCKDVTRYWENKVISLCDANL